MPKSMTGFGRGVVDASFGRLIVEIQSINRKHLEVALQIPREMFSLEHVLRKWVKTKIFRGHVSLRLQILPSKQAIKSSLPDIEVLKEIKTGWEGISKKLDLDPKGVDLGFISSVMPHTERQEFDEKDLKHFQKCVEKALDDLCSMKAEEGKHLSEDITHRLQEIQVRVSKIEKLFPSSSEKMRQKLTEKMKSLFEADEGLEDRLLREVALYAEKVDISEEIVRLTSHFIQFEKGLKLDGSVGRKLEFVLQEIGREINTIGSKSVEAEISVLVVEIKAELEKIREQIQNIE